MTAIWTVKTQRKPISSRLKNGSPSKPIFAHILSITIQNLLFALKSTLAFKILWVMFSLQCLCSTVCYYRLLLRYSREIWCRRSRSRGFFGVKSSPARIYSRRSCVCWSVPLAWETNLSCLFLLSLEVLEPFNAEFMRFIERIIERSWTNRSNP